MRLIIGQIKTNFKIGCLLLDGVFTLGLIIFFKYWNQIIVIPFDEVRSNLTHEIKYN